MRRGYLLVCLVCFILTVVECQTGFQDWSCVYNAVAGIAIGRHIAKLKGVNEACNDCQNCALQGTATCANVDECEVHPTGAPTICRCKAKSQDKRR